MASEEGSTDSGTNRRALLKGAVAAGAATVAYTAPIIAQVPSYAAHGLTTNFVQSGDMCIGFSPNHRSSEGDWHVPSADVTNVYQLVSPATWSDGAANIGAIATNTTPIEFDVRVPPTAGGTWHRVKVGGHFNNWDGGTGGGFSTTGWNGGGIRVQVVDSNCEMLIVGWFQGTTADASSCTTSVGSLSMKPSDSPINGSDPGTTATTGGYAFTGVKYFHSGQPRKGGNWVSGIRFRIRCFDTV